MPGRQSEAMAPKPGDAPWLSRDDLSRVATGRVEPLFDPDLRALDDELRARLDGERVLVIGGAGSIGSATVAELTRYDLSALHVVDQNENTLAELVRDLRGRQAGLAVRDFRTIPLDFGGAVMRGFLEDQAPYGLVLNFAAIKHVRSEKDSYSLLQMFDTNVLKARSLLEWLTERGGTRRYFCVSTDKAANPVNLMGASKRLMECVTLTPESLGAGFSATAARFANVAFSDGSLLDAWLRRLEKGQPLAVPRDTRRYFISRHEAGQLCLLAAVAGPAGQIMIPRMAPEENLRELTGIAAGVLSALGLEFAPYADETEARGAVASELARGRYPVLVSALDTMGEKSYEEFVGAGEQVVDLGWPNILGVSAPAADPGAIDRVLAWLRARSLGAEPRPSKREFVAAIGAAIPSLHHVDSERTLDDRL
jgi:FlaA1/EpsC-like NDP-sugar epimerase